MQKVYNLVQQNKFQEIFLSTNFEKFYPEKKNRLINITHATLADFEKTINEEAGWLNDIPVKPV